MKPVLGGFWQKSNKWLEPLPERIFKAKESQLRGVVRMIADGGGEAAST